MFPPAGPQFLTRVFGQDFRSENGLYNLVKAKYPNAVVKGRDLFDAVLWSDPTSTSLFYTFLASLRNEVLAVSDPTPVHKFIRTLAETGRLLRCYTQNIDGLEEREGLLTDLAYGRGKRRRPTPITAVDTRTDQEKGCQVVQLHGNLATLRCTNCQLQTAYTAAAVSMLLDGDAPTCAACAAASASRQAAGKRATKVGLLRPNIVLYGEEHPDGDRVGGLVTADIAASPDLLIILGTSLKVHGLKNVVRQFCRAVHARGGSVVFVNNTPPAEGTWAGLVDYHVDMDCDAWVADIRTRRAGIWERQTRLTVQKISKPCASEGDKENAVGQHKRKAGVVVVPETPRARKTLGRAHMSPLQETPYLSPPASRKRAFRTAPAAMPKEICEDVLRTPTKRRRVAGTTKVIESIVLESPPATPTVKGGRMVGVLISASPVRQLREEMKIFEDRTNEVEAVVAVAKNKKKEPEPGVRRSLRNAVIAVAALA